jgi:molybdopterin converting factor small subunit
VNNGITITVGYFAQLREQAGCSGETWQPAARDAAGLYEELRMHHGFKLERQHLRVAVNDGFAEWNYELQAGDRVVFIPPVAGG